MGILDRFERRLDRMVNGAFARAFKSEVQPVEIASALQRECDDRAAIVTRGRTIVPNAFSVDLSPTDYERLAVYRDALSQELADVVREHAGEQGYAFVGPLEVTIKRDEALETGLFRVLGEAEPGEIAPDTHLPNAWLDVAGQQVRLTQDVSVIGRGTEADVQVTDPGVSRRHAMLRLRPTPSIIDLGSTNGMLVDDQRSEQADLFDGSVITLGSTRIVFRTAGA
ncbi:MAG: FhaA domain-containing protein [Actinomycetes bacterium]